MAAMKRFVGWTLMFAPLGFVLWRGVVTEGWATVAAYFFMGLVMILLFVIGSALRDS